METTASLFDKLAEQVTGLLELGHELLKLANDVVNNQKELSTVNTYLTDKGITMKTFVKLFIVNETVTLLDAQIRTELLHAPNENFIYNYLFFLLKNQSDLNSVFSRAYNIDHRYGSLYPEAKKYYEGGRRMTLRIPYENEGQLIACGEAAIKRVVQIPDDLIHIIRKEFSIKHVDSKRLFEHDRFFDIPAPLPRLKTIFSATPEDLLLLNSDKKERINKISWNGNLKEFAELINELETKGWIEPIAHGELNLTVKTLTECFDLTKTKKKDESNTENSLMQCLKPSEREYRIFSKRYIRKFSAILFNSLKK